MNNNNNNIMQMQMQKQQEVKRDGSGSHTQNTQDTPPPTRPQWSEQPVPVAIVTGFLGCGKTTLVKRILEYKQKLRHQPRVVALVNDFADFNVDANSIGGKSKAVQLSDGCVCCTINDAFVLTLQKVIETQAPDYIVIETSGVSDPYPIVEALRQTHHLARARACALDVVITLVDASAFQQMYTKSTAMRRQIQAADLILLNKMDLATERQVTYVESLVQNLSHKPKCLKCVRAAVPLSLVLGHPGECDIDTNTAQGQSAALRSGSEDEAQRAFLQWNAHLDSDGISTFSFESASPVSMIKLHGVLAHLPEGVLRAKGFLRYCCMPECTFEIHLSGRRFESDHLHAPPFQEADVGARLVFIGMAMDEAKLLEDLQACVCSEPCGCLHSEQQRQAIAGLCRALRARVESDRRFVLCDAPSWNTVAWSLRGSYGKLGTLSRGLLGAANKELVARTSKQYAQYLITAEYEGECPCMMIEIGESTDIKSLWSCMQKESFVVLSNLVDPKQQELYGGVDVDV